MVNIEEIYNMSMNRLNLSGVEIKMYMRSEKKSLQRRSVLSSVGNNFQSKVL